jgi:hypothetical protein
MRMLLIVVALMFCTVAQSAEQQKKPAAVNKENPQAHQSGTEQNPFVIKILPAQGNDKKSAEQQHSEQKELQEKRAADATWALFWVTLALAAFTAGLFGANWSLLKDSKKSAQAARDSADAAKDAFLATHRPEIRVKHVYNTSEGIRPLKIKLILVNVGLTPAIIQHLNVQARVLPVDKNLPPRPDFPVADNRVVPNTVRQLESGAEVILPGVVQREVTEAEHPQIMNGVLRLYCYGRVVYHDIKGLKRETAFGRLWEPPVGMGSLSEPGRFRDTYDPDYEYHD